MTYFDLHRRQRKCHAKRLSRKHEEGDASARQRQAESGNIDRIQRRLFWSCPRRTINMLLAIYFKFISKQFKVLTYICHPFFLVASVSVDQAAWDAAMAGDWDDSLASFCQAPAALHLPENLISCFDPTPLIPNDYLTASFTTSPTSAFAKSGKRLHQEELEDENRFELSPSKR